MKLVAYDGGNVGRVDGEEIVRLDVPDLRTYFERSGADDLDERIPLADADLRAPIVPKKFFHTAGNFREHEEESKRVDWSHEIAPWIVFFQNVDAIVGPDEPVVYPEHLTDELDYELELAVVIRKAGKWFSPEEAVNFIGGYVIFNDITALGYSAGDVVSTGTVSGVAGFSDDPASLYLKPGDVMEAEIERIGVLRNPVVSWQEGHGEPA